tara:strand:+ start:354 stop:917 length:564 start_codon:yes stop_codon:yes gene_type:complete
VDYQKQFSYVDFTGETRMTLIDFVKQRIQSIIELKKERHFIPGMMLGSYAIVILATVMSIWSFMLLGKLDNPFFNGLLPVASLFFPFYVAALTILAGKEIIWCHMMIFKQTDNLFRKMIDKYSLNYYKKHKKDPPILDKFSKIQYKLFGRFTKLPPKIQKRIKILGIIGWFAYMIGNKMSSSLNGLL